MLDLTQLPAAFLLPFRAIFGWGSPYGLPSLCGAFLFMLGYGISRTTHHDNLRRLADAAAAAELAEEVGGVATTH